jgi:hypothetical protein
LADCTGWAVAAGLGAWSFGEVFSDGAAPGVAAADGPGAVVGVEFPRFGVSDVPFTSSPRS